MIKHYSISKSHNDKTRLSIVAEKIYVQQKNLIGKTISWESLTTKWLWFEMPETALENNIWVQERPKWMRAFNDEWERRGNTIRFFNEPTKGVKLLEGSEMVNTVVTKDTKRLSKCHNNVIKNANGIIRGNPEGKKIIQKWSAGIRRTSIYMHGEIQLSSLPLWMKRDLLKIIKDSLPHELE